jgi:hypothetical protein
MLGISKAAGAEQRQLACTFEIVNNYLFDFDSRAGLSGTEARGIASVLI